MPPMMTADPNAGLGKAGPSGVHTAAAASSSAPHEPAPAATRTNNNTINNTTDREGCRDVGRDVGRDGGRVQTKTEEEGWIGRDGTSEPKGWGACRKIKK